jgi:hypothetical protein
VTDLNSLLDSTINGTIYSATGINDKGQIVADSAGYVYLLTPDLGPQTSPVPAASPVTPAGTAIALALCGMLWRRKKL